MVFKLIIAVVMSLAAWLLGWGISGAFSGFGLASFVVGLVCAVVMFIGVMRRQ